MNFLEFIIHILLKILKPLNILQITNFIMSSISKSLFIIIQIKLTNYVTYWTNIIEYVKQGLKTTKWFKVLVKCFPLFSQSSSSKREISSKAALMCILSKKIFCRHVCQHFPNIYTYILKFSFKKLEICVFYIYLDNNRNV